MAHEVEEITIEEFERRLDELMRRGPDQTVNQGSYGSESCVYCKGCMFCNDCEYCYRCNYCDGCVGCSQCTKCQGCESCHSCAYCIDSERCVGSAFLVRSLDCADCTYCFGCVGLTKKSFHILNEPYGRTEYFRAIEPLKAALGMT